MIVLIIQARMASTRLPGKVLMPIAGVPLIKLLIARLSPAKKVNHLIVATSTNAEDDRLAEYCTANHIDVFRGSDWDVLDRFYNAAMKFNPVPSDAIIRICADNPLHSHKVVDFIIAGFKKDEVDYFSNSNHEPDFLEDGFDTEIFTFSALETAWNEAKLLSEREHVTPYIKNCGKFRCGWKKANKEYNYKLSVDTPEDFAVAESIFYELKETPDFSIDDVVALIKEKPYIIGKNRSSVINSGYYKSLKEDRIVK